MSDSLDRQEGEIQHEIRGVFDETRVDCGKEMTIYGPHPDAEKEFRYCPYCGDKADEGDHDNSAISGEVMCPNTGMSTYRYCPGCGMEVDIDG